MEHPAVADSAVIPKRGRRVGGEIPKAFVVLHRATSRPPPRR